MTKEEIIHAISDDKLMPFIQPDHLAQIVDFVIKNYHPSLPSNLDEAANRQAALEQPYKWEEEQDDSFGVTPLFVMSNIRSAFKAGAEWQRERMLKDVVNAYIYGSSNPVSESGRAHQISAIYEEQDNTPHILAGDKVKLIIIKED